MTINVNLKIFLFAILFYFTKQIEIYALLMFFAFIHEMGHLICGLLLGLKPKALKIMPLGICIEFSVIYKDYNKKIKNGNVLDETKIIKSLETINYLINENCKISHAGDGWPFRYQTEGKPWIIRKLVWI